MKFFFTAKIKLLLSLILLSIFPVYSQNIYRPHNPYSSLNSLKIGDVIMVIFLESQKIKFYFKLDRDDEIVIKSSPDRELTKFLPKVESTKSISRSKKGEMTGTNSFKGRMSVLVQAQNNNGTFRIGGTKSLNFDGQLATLELSGVVHSRDINSNYEISSGKIANLRIIFQGQLVKKKRSLTAFSEEELKKAGGKDILPGLSSEDRRSILQDYLEEIIGEIMDQNR